MLWGRLAGDGVGNGESAHALRDITRRYAFERVAASTERSYEPNWGIWVSWRFCREGVLDAEQHVGSGAGKRTRRIEMVFFCTGKGSKESTIVDKTVAINFFCHD